MNKKIEETNQNINFSEMLEYINNYAGKEYERITQETSSETKTIMEQRKQAGQKAINELEKLTKICEERTGLKSYANNKQWLIVKGTKLKDYLWVQLKKQDKIDKPESISIFVEKSSKNQLGQFRISLEINNGEARKTPDEIEKYHKHLDIPLNTEKGLKYYFGSNEKYNIKELYESQEEIKEKVKSGRYEKVQISKVIEEQKELTNEQYLEKILDAIDNLLPYYEYITTNENKEEHYYMGQYGSDDKRKEMFIANELFALGWENEYGDLRQYIKTHSKAPNTALANLTKLQKGDIIYLVNRGGRNKTKIYAKGIVKEDFGNEKGYEFKQAIGHTISVKWEKYDTPKIINGMVGPSLEKISEGKMKMVKQIENYDYYEEDIPKVEDSKKQQLNLERNIIYYGAPGCGKSHKVNNILQNFDDYDRILFYPDYSYSEFIGQITPKLEKDKNNENIVRYKFIPGPFLTILKKALTNKEKNYCLVIEEINRGNAAAIFGDIFQLLDRQEKGNSEYFIRNDQISEYLAEKDKIAPNGFNLEKIYIPSNLYIFATMNTCDQNVFTLDTAFKRRWSFEKISNKFDENSKEEQKQKNTLISDLGITWGEFQKAINTEISIKLTEYGIDGEDKQLGKYFVKENELKDKNSFAKKVLLYLWEDVVKVDRTILFKEKYKTLDELIEDFIGNEGIKIFNIFTQEENRKDNDNE